MLSITNHTIMKGRITIRIPEEDILIDVPKTLVIDFFFGRALPMSTSDEVKKILRAYRNEIFNTLTLPDEVEVGVLPF